MTTVESERRRMVNQLIEDAQLSNRRTTHEQKVAALLLALEMLDPARPGIRYSTTVGETTATAQVSYEAIMLAAQVQDLIDELNSCEFV